MRRIHYSTTQTSQEHITVEGHFIEMISIMKYHVNIHDTMKVDYAKHYTKCTFVGTSKMYLKQLNMINYFNIEQILSNPNINKEFEKADYIDCMIILLVQSMKQDKNNIWIGKTNILAV